ncbi:hypothetical protein PO002_27665 [Cupriavidus necator]|uniref:hypothetical protein n=1 Tax=Cupriavidus necator TaxID=106590 RepID=UPI0039C16839
MVSDGVFWPGVLIVAYDDDVPMNELICDGTTPVLVHSEAMLLAEMQALQVRSRFDNAALQVDVRLPAIRGMLQRIASTTDNEQHAEPAQPRDHGFPQSAQHTSRTSWRHPM